MGTLIATYGYLAVMLGTLAEGETALIGGGYAARNGWLALLPMMVAAFTGAFAGDQIFFYLGRRHGHRIMQRRAHWAKRVAKLQALLQRHETLAVMSFRFLYGLRVATPVALGMTAVSYTKYLTLTLLSGITWTILFGLGGYYLGEAMSHLQGDIELLEIYGLGAILTVGGLVFAIRHSRKEPSRTSKHD